MNTTKSPGNRQRTSKWIRPAGPATVLTILGLMASMRGADRPRANATNWLAVTGMHCEGCARGLNSELRRIPGVITATVTFTNRLAIVVYDTNQVSLTNLLKAVAEAGYGAKPIDQPRNQRRD